MCTHTHMTKHTAPMPALAAQGALSFLGPVMWGWLALDLAYKAIGTDYARVIRAVFILAQVCGHVFVHTYAHEHVCVCMKGTTRIGGCLGLGGLMVDCASLTVLCTPTCLISMLVCEVY